jgi:hypothetical protein
MPVGLNYFLKKENISAGEYTIFVEILIGWGLK